MNKQKLKECDFYSLAVIGGIKMAIKRSGFCDSVWQYYKEGYLWYAVDYMTGQPVCAADSLKEVVELANDSFSRDNVNPEHYEKACVEWDKLLVTCGAYRR